jgi:hypothetical protein
MADLEPGKVAQPREGDIPMEGATVDDEAEVSDSPQDDGAEPGRTATEIGVHSTFGDVRDSEVAIAGAIFNNEYNQNILGGVDADWILRRELSSQDFEPLPAEQLRGRERDLVPVEEDLALVAECLAHRRISVVVGDKGLGKGALCMLAAARIVERDPAVREVLIASALDRTVRWRPDGWFGGKRGHRRRILVFEDVFDDGNPDLARYFDRLDETRLDSVRTRLVDSDCYLLLTTAPEPLEVRRERLRRLGVLCEVALPSESTLLRVLHRRLVLRPVAVDDGTDAQAESEAQKLLDKRGSWLAVRLRTIPRTVRFVDEMLGPVCRGEVALERALDSLDDLDHWVLSELPKEPARWTFVLALVLASADPRSRWVPWLLLHGLWRIVEEALQQELHWWGEEEARPLKRLVVDRGFLASTRAEVRRLPYPIGDAVRFVDPRTAERLWRVLLAPGRALLAVLLSRVITLADSEHSPLRPIAARAIGRIGEIEPARLVLSRLSEALDTDGDLTGLGETLVGVLSSEDRTYVAGSLDRLQSVAASGALEPKARALAVLPSLGSADPEQALDMLERLLEARFARVEVDPAAVKHRLNTLFEQAESGQEPGMRSVEALTRGVLDPDVQVLLDGTQFVILGLCFAGHGAPAFRRLAKGLASGSPRVSPWIALLVLRDRGILAILEAHPLRVPVSDTDADVPRTAKASRLLLAAEEPEDVAALSESLETAYAASESFPLRLRSRLRENLLSKLEGWIRQGARLPLLRGTVRRLLADLRDCADPGLRTAVFDLLRRLSQQPSSSESPRELALEILRTGVPGERLGTGEVSTK